MSESDRQQKDEPAASGQQKQFAIQRLYLKDASFESPGAPFSFAFQKWDPKIDLNLGNSQKHVDGDTYEAVLNVTATVKLEDKTIFLIEVQYAGLFALAGFDEEERRYLLGSQCMNIVFPYAREVVSDLTMRGGFPPLILSPVNFDALYQQHLQQQEQKDETGSAAH
jgi:preprotein translocase subunit SecB